MSMAAGTAGLPDLETLTAGGTKIGFRQAGDQDATDAVVFLHGLGGSAATWRRQYEGLSSRRRVIGWDMPGYGGSDPLPGRPVPRDYAEALARFLSALGLERVHLVGQSVAALVASAFCAASPDRVRSLVLAHPLTGFGGLPRGEREEAAAARIRPFEEQRAQAFAAARAPRLLSRHTSAALADEIVSTMASVPREGYVKAVRMMIDADLLAEAPSLAQPSLVISGAEDPLAPPETCRALAALITGTETALIDRAGHYAALERADAFNGAIEGFVDRIADRKNTMPHD